MPEETKEKHPGEEPFFSEEEIARLLEALCEDDLKTRTATREDDLEHGRSNR